MTRGEAQRRYDRKHRKDNNRRHRRHDTAIKTRFLYPSRPWTESEIIAIFDFTKVDLETIKRSVGAIWKVRWTYKSKAPLNWSSKASKRID
jgi:hypothetical protein